MIIGSQIQEWTRGVNGVLVKERTLNTDLLEKESQPLKCFQYCTPVLRDYVHFGQQQKPWLHQPPDFLTDETRLDTAQNLWYHTLKKLNEEFRMGLDFVHWKAQPPPLGLKPSWEQSLGAQIRFDGPESVFIDG